MVKNMFFFFQYLYTLKLLLYNFSEKQLGLD